MTLIELIGNASAEPQPDLACCSDCGNSYPVSECPSETEGDWETGYYTVHVCPKCEDGGHIDDYCMSAECADEWSKWKANS